jgi:hypothetical protein
MRLAAVALTAVLVPEVLALELAGPLIPLASVMFPNNFWRPDWLWAGGGLVLDDDGGGAADVFKDMDGRKDI